MFCTKIISLVQSVLVGSNQLNQVDQVHGCTINVNLVQSVWALVEPIYQVAQVHSLVQTQQNPCPFSLLITWSGIRF